MCQFSYNTLEWATKEFWGFKVFCCNIAWEMWMQIQVFYVKKFCSESSLEYTGSSHNAIFGTWKNSH